MKTLYIECAMGAAGDMLAAALLELLPDRAEPIFPSGWRESRKTRTSIVIITTMFTAAWRALRKS